MAEIKKEFRADPKPRRRTGWEHITGPTDGKSTTCEQINTVDDYSCYCH